MNIVDINYLPQILITLSNIILLKFYLQFKFEKS